MLQNNSLQVKNVKIQYAHQVSKIKSAFRPISILPAQLKSIEKLNNSIQESSIHKQNRQLSPPNLDKHLNHDGQAWHRAQIEKLFKLYDYYGPQWKIMSQQMPSRTANNLKNRFYTVLRNLIKLLFRKKADTCPKLPGQIPSKDLSRLYDGKEDYIQFQSLIPNLLKEIDYNLDSQNIENVVRKYSTEIIQVYHSIYGQRALVAQEDSKLHLKRAQELQPTLLTTSSSINKGEDCQKLPQQVQQAPNSNKIKPFQKGAIPQQQDYYYFFFFNPTDFFMPQGV